MMAKAHRACFLSILCIVVAAYRVSPASAQAQAAPPSKNAPIKIVLVGDSTTAQITGWGGAFCDLHVTGMVACLPMGRGGRSTKTYRAEGSWDLALAEMRVPGYAATYVLIEMGHNDKNSDPTIGTALKGGEFTDNLLRFVEEVRAAGGAPILVTPLAARHFKDGRLADSLGPWANEVRSVAVRTKTPIIDLNQSSSQLFKHLGAVGSLGFEQLPPTEPELRAASSGTTLAGRIAKSVPIGATEPADDPRRSYNADYIHLNRDGARQIAALVAQGLITALPELKGHVLP